MLKIFAFSERTPNFLINLLVHILGKNTVLSFSLLFVKFKTREMRNRKFPFKVLLTKFGRHFATPLSRYHQILCSSLQRAENR